MMAGEFTLQDFADQLRQVRKMGPIGQLLEMLPGGMGQMARQISPEEAEKQLKDDRSDYQFDDGL
jgi:signal recognition particle subunit SRP54